MGDEEAQPLCLDACSAINLAAVDDLGILGSRLGQPLVAVQNAASESLYLRDGDGGCSPIDLTGLQVLELHDEELDIYIQLAAIVDDGEAATLAVALHRGLVVVTDDRKAVREAARLVRSVRTVGTAAIVRRLAAREELGAREVAAALRRIEARANFRPRPQDPDFAWWAARGRHSFPVNVGRRG